MNLFSRRFVISFLTMLLAFGILFVSVLRTASVHYSFNTKVLSSFPVSSLTSDIDYGLVFPGQVLPGDWLWPLKALRDRLWILTTVDLTKKMELYLLLADKRLGASVVLFERGKYELGVTTLNKAEGYLKMASETEMIARTRGLDTKHFVYKLILASFKHRELIRAFQTTAPDDVRNSLVVIENYPRSLYEEKNSLLKNENNSGLINPYEGQ
jgi:hypothetical protein